MKIIAHSNIATRFGAICALAVAGALLTGSISPAFAHKGGGGGGKGGHHGQHQPKQPKNPGPIGPLPKPPSQGQWHATPKPVVVRDHRTPKVVTTTSGGGVKVTSTATVNDHRAKPEVRDQRAGSSATDSKAGSGGSVSKSVKTAVGGVVKSVKRAIGSGTKIAMNSKYPGRPKFKSPEARQ